MSGWSLTLLGGSSPNPELWGVQSDLTGATGRTISVYLDQPHEISFDMAGKHAEAALIEELYSDVVASYDDGTGTGPQDLVRCRVGPTTDTGNGTSSSVNFRALSYKALLDRKITYADITIPVTPGSDPLFEGGLENVGWTLIGHAQARTNGTLGIHRGIHDTTNAGGALISAAILVEDGSVIGEQITKAFTENPTGYDWDIEADLTYQTYARPRRRTGDPSVGHIVLDYGGAVASFTRTVDPSAYANAVRVAGGTPETPPGGYTVPISTATSAEVAAGTARQGRWEKQYSDPDLFNTARTSDRAAQQVADSQVITPTYTLTLTPGMWQGPAGLWVGDLVQVVIQAGRLNVDTPLVVESMTFGVGDDGGDTVTVSCGGLPPRDVYYQRQRKLLADVARLERR